MLVAQVASSKALPDETVAAVVERTGGVPLFVEELTRAVLESGGGRLSGAAIPVTLHDSLMARLDPLGPAKEIVQIGAVIGAEFSYELLRAVHPISEPCLQHSLRSLTDAELLYARGIAPEATYQFKRALIRDAAYEALLKSRRKELHLTIARTIHEKFPAIEEAQPEVLAQHWAEAGEIFPAIDSWQKAGERAIERRAYREAEQHLNVAIGLLQTLPESRERAARELKPQYLLADLMTGTRGYSARDTLEGYSRARLLTEQAGQPVSLGILNGLRGAAVTRGDLRSALAIADEILVAAQASGHSAELAIAHNQQQNSRYYLGDLIGARRHFLLSMEIL
jgi:predicted ATPase